MNARVIAGRVVYRVLSDGQSLTPALENALQDVQGKQDRAFIMALCFGTIRYYYRLEFILNQLLRKPLKNLDVKALLLLGLYQLQYTRVKTHAAVSETVSAVRNKPWAKSLVNAVLRRYLREQQALESLADADISAACAHPEWLIRILQQNWPDQVQQLLTANNQPPPMGLRVNLSRIGRAAMLQKILDLDMPVSAAPIGCSGMILHQPVQVEQLPGFSDGLVSVQDIAAQLAAELLVAGPGHRVLDVCAAPGGKTAHILELQPDLAALIAVDIDEVRLAKVKENMLRLGLRAKIIAGDAAAPDKWWDGQKFDRILLDAPCSALGVIRRHPDIKVLRKMEDMAKLQTLQQQILDAVWPLLERGGQLLYATCSVLKQENSLQMQNFLLRHSDAREAPINAAWGIEQPVGRQILTGESGMDGFYYARLLKQ